MLSILFEGPKEGTLYNRNLQIPVRVFSLSDLRSGVIGYKHNPNGKRGPDNVILQASDGFHLITFLFYIEVREKVTLALNTSLSLWSLMNLLKVLNKPSSVTIVLPDKCVRSTWFYVRYTFNDTCLLRSNIRNKFLCHYFNKTYVMLK